jgi:hypothetical protein
MPSNSACHSRRVLSIRSSKPIYRVRMPGGKPSSQHTAEEKAAIRRQKVKLNVRAHRERQKQKRGIVHPGSPVQSTLRWVRETKWESRGSADHAQVRNQAQPSTAVRSQNKPSWVPMRCLPYAPSPGTQYTMALLGLFRSRFLPDRIILPTLPCPDRQIATPCASWVVNAYDLAVFQDKTALQDMLRSLALGVVGAENQREDIQIISRHSYQRTLFGLRRQLLSLINGGIYCAYDFLALVLSCHVAALFELTINTSLSDMFRHVRGIGSLILHRIYSQGPVSEILSHLIEEYRMLEICFSLAYRRTSALKAPKGSAVVANSSRLAEEVQVSHLGGLLDIGDRIPPVIVQLDSLISTSVIDQSLPQLYNILKELSDIIAHVEVWYSGFLARYGPVIMQSTISSSVSDNLDFPSLEVAAAWVYSLSFKLYALNTYISTCTQVSLFAPAYGSFSIFQDNLKAKNDQHNFDHGFITHLRTKVFNTAHLLSRSLPYFFEARIGITGRSLAVFPLAAAKDAFKQEMGRCSNADRIVDAIHHHEGVPNVRQQRSHEIAQALLFCESLELKAKSFGLPLFS